MTSACMIQPCVRRSDENEISFFYRNYYNVAFLLSSSQILKFEDGVKDYC